MSIVYKGFLTDANGQNPRSFLYGVPSGGSGVKCSAWPEGPGGSDLGAMGKEFIEHYAGYTDRVPPTIDNYCTIICRYSNSGSPNIGYSRILNITNSAILVEDGTSIIFWFAKTTAQIGLPTTRNIVFTRDSGGRCTAYFRVGSTSKFSVLDGSFGNWLAPWIYPDIEYNSNITGCAGGIQLYSYYYEDSQTYRVRIPYDMSLPSYYDTAWTDLMQEWFDGVPTPYDLNDPYIEMGDSEPSGKPSGGGIPTGDAVTIPSLPSVSVADTGFVTLFNPTLAQVKNLASYMWGSFFDISTFKKIFADPMDCILGFNLLPVTIPNGGAENVIVGNISTGVSMTKAGSQWVEVDCGTINIGKPYDNYLDYSPYTKYSIYLPYIGTVDLSADDCVGKDIHLVYHVDVLSCSCVAYLKCGDSVLYQFTGSCGYSIPLTSENFRSMISSIVSIAGSIAGVVASGGASAPLTIGAVANTANNVMGLKPDIHRSGAIGSSAGLMGIQTPYLILQFPNPCKPAQQYKYMGYPSFVTVTVGDLSGYTEFDSIILDELTCDEDEKQLIEDILKGGVFL